MRSALALCIALLPGLALAQQAEPSADPAQVAASPPADAESAAQRLGFSVARDVPLVINSEELEVKPDRRGRRRVVFSNQVRAQQADMLLTSDWLEAAYPKDGGGQPERVTARGHVRISQPPNSARCQEAVFDNVACTATCIGGTHQASLQRDDDVIEADEIFFDLCKGLVKARGGAKVRVRGETAAE